MSTIVIECVVGNAPVVTGTADPVTGLDPGSTTVTCDGFTNVRITLRRGGMRVQSLPSSTDSYYTKFFEDNFFTVSSAFVSGEVVYIQTIV